MSDKIAADSWYRPNSKCLKPVTLEGRFVRLLPLELSHTKVLAQAGNDQGLWQWNPTNSSMDEATMSKVVQQALKSWEAGQQLPFVIEEKANGRLVGSTRYIAPDEAHRRLEIGGTWLDPAVHRTKVNPETKYLLLKQAFEVLGCKRVEFKTDSLNERSRGALLKLGAAFEGVFRNHMITSTGRLRHSAYYSIIFEEWPIVKQNLEKRLEL